METRKKMLVMDLDGLENLSLEGPLRICLLDFFV